MRARLRTPHVFQGMYNALTRGVEAELMPLLRERNIAFYAYNPLAGGLLTGKHLARACRRRLGRPLRRQYFYQDRYWRRELFGALDAVRSCVRQGVGWRPWYGGGGDPLAGHHSALMAATV